jgi:hypothetical protein
MKTKDQLEIGDIIITEEEYEEICGENQWLKITKKKQ